jgi:hypothetical protein
MKHIIIGLIGIVLTIGVMRADEQCSDKPEGSRCSPTIDHPMKGIGLGPVVIGTCVNGECKSNW